MHIQFECNLCVLNLATQSECNGYVLAHFPQKHCGACDKSVIQIGDEWYELRIHVSDQCGADFLKNTGITFVTVPECTKLERSPSPLLVDYDVPGIVEVKEEPPIEYNDTLSTTISDNVCNDMNKFTAIPPVQAKTSQTSYQADNNHSAESQQTIERFKCDLCDKCYCLKGNLQRHMKRDHNVRMKTTYNCPWCNQAFDRRHFRLRHIETTHKDKTTNCKICGKFCTSESILQKHLTEVHKQELFIKAPQAELETMQASYQADDDHSAESQHANNKISRFKCDLCDRGYRLKNSLQRHMKVDHDQKMKVTYTCPWCNHVFDSRKSQLRHIESIHKDKRFDCKICGRLCDSESILQKHLTEVHKQNFFKCTICRAAFSDGKLLIEHTKENHKELGNECEHCEMTFVSSMSLSRHLRTQHSQRKCKLCDEIFYGQELFAGHVKEMHENSIRKCEACGETFYTKDSFRRHFRKYPDHMEPKEFKCQLCQEIFNRQRELTQHYKNTHKGDKFVCDICNKEFKLPGMLKYHRNLHAGELNPFCCKICGKSFSRSKSLSYHETIHTKKPYLTCDICKKQFTHKHYLQVHMRRHYNAKKFPCEVCNKAFWDSKAVHIHRQVVHEKKIFFECEICNKNFHRKVYLVEHMFRHTNPNDFKFICDHCGKGFHQKGSLKDHIDRHNGVKRHACSHCNKRFVKSSQLITHQRAHTNERPYKCTIENCDRIFRSPTGVTGHLAYAHGIYRRKHTCSICSKFFVFPHLLKKHMESHEKSE